MVDLMLITVKIKNIKHWNKKVAFALWAKAYSHVRAIYCLKYTYICAMLVTSLFIYFKFKNLEKKLKSSFFFFLDFNNYLWAYG